MIEQITLRGAHVRLEPLEERHIDDLVRASGGADPELYRMSAVPVGLVEVRDYVQTALRRRDAGTALPFATVRLSDETVVGSTRFFDFEWFFGRRFPDTCEIGYTWLNHTAIRSAVNTEAKFLMLRHAFEEWDIASVCLHTDARNARSRAAIERIGAKFEGVLRAHRPAADGGLRNSARYSIVAAEWPQVKARLLRLLTRTADN
jgi:RimJ/RimL family protein N-acetyltransferase